jgi:hypothetical protein
MSIGSTWPLANSSGVCTTKTRTPDDAWLDSTYESSLNDEYSLDSVEASADSVPDRRAGPTPQTWPANVS